MSKITVAALYKFVDLPDYKSMQGPIKRACEESGVKGTLLLAHEGINGTIAGPRDGINTVLSLLLSYPALKGMDIKESTASEMPFLRIKVRLKKEIVTIGVPEVSPVRIVGTYLEPEDWNEVISDPEVIVIDTRNDYEVGIGTFKGAVNPKTDSFREFPDYVQKNLNPKQHKKVAMFCTGGIRCEKASSYMLAEGFEEVYHLKGGILKYLKTIPADKSLWEGECFVFDQRVAVTHGLEEGTHNLCFGCRMPLGPEHLKHDDYIKGVQCPYCADDTDDERKSRAAERQRQIDLAKERGEKHLGG